MRNVEKYDMSYEKEFTAIWIGIIILAINIFLYFNPPNISSQTVYEYSIPIRVLIAIWVYRITKRQNRNGILSAILTFFFPAIMLIVAGRRNKLKT